MFVAFFGAFRNFSFLFRGVYSFPNKYMAVMKAFELESISMDVIFFDKKLGVFSVKQKSPKNT